MRIVYVGPSPEVVIIVEGGGIHAERGVPVDVADVLGFSLLEQAIWSECSVAVPAASVESAAVPQEEI